MKHQSSDDAELQALLDAATLKIASRVPLAGDTASLSDALSRLQSIDRSRLAPHVRAKVTHAIGRAMNAKVLSSEEFDDSPQGTRLTELIELMLEDISSPYDSIEDLLRDDKFPDLFLDGYRRIIEPELQVLGNKFGWDVPT